MQKLYGFKVLLVDYPKSLGEYDIKVVVLHLVEFSFPKCLWDIVKMMFCACLCMLGGLDKINIS